MPRSIKETTHEADNQPESTPLHHEAFTRFLQSWKELLQHLNLTLFQTETPDSDSQKHQPPDQNYS